MTQKRNITDCENRKRQYWGRALEMAEFTCALSSVRHPPSFAQTSLRHAPRSLQWNPLRRNREFVQARAASEMIEAAQAVPHTDLTWQIAAGAIGIWDRTFVSVVQLWFKLALLLVTAFCVPLQAQDFTSLCNCFCAILSLSHSIRISSRSSSGFWLDKFLQSDFQMFYYSLFIL